MESNDTVPKQPEDTESVISVHNEWLAKAAFLIGSGNFPADQPTIRL